MSSTAFSRTRRSLSGQKMITLSAEMDPARVYRLRKKQRTQGFLLLINLKMGFNHGERSWLVTCWLKCFAGLLDLSIQMESSVKTQNQRKST